MRVPLALVVAGVPALAGAAVALAAPTSSAPPTISGTPQYDTPLTCNPGTWTDAVSFTYAWMEGRSFVAATGQVFTPKAPNLDRSYYCRVTATDAAGATSFADSAPVKIAHQKMTLKASLSSPRAERLRVVAVVGPTAALRATSSRKASLTLYRVLSGRRFAQLTIPPKVVPANGRLTFTVKTPPGRSTFMFQVSGADRSLYDTTQVRRSATVKRARARR